MALTYTQLSALTEKLIERELADGVYEASEALAFFNSKKKKRSGGEQIKLPVINSKPGSSSRYFEDLDTLDITASENITAAEFDWKNLQEPVRIAKTELLKNNGDEAKVSLLASKMEVAETNLAENLSLGLFSDGTAGTGAATTKQLVGFQQAIKATGTYGGIATADFAEWVAPVKSNSGTNRALSLALVQQAIGEATYGSKKPDVMIASQAVYDELWAITQGHQRLTSPEFRKLGFENVIVVNGIPAIVDEHMPANTMYFVNSNHTYLIVHSKQDMVHETIERMETTHSQLTRILWMGALVSNGRRYNSSLTDIAVAS